jgi:hypothetical protein
MPVKRRVSKRRADLEDGAEQWLRGEPCGFFKFKRQEDLSALWAEHGDRIVAEWVADNPDTRPALWWRYSAPAPRQDGESQAAYLERHGLFLPGERKRLRKGDFEGRAPHAQSLTSISNRVGRAV